jgi:phosphinothricin acetyltransferase
MNGDTLIRDAAAADAAAIAAIYNVHVRDTIVTFELHEVGVDDMAQRMALVHDLGLPWLVLEERGVVIGYAYGGQWKARAAYARTVESSIYLADAACGRGLGKYLYAELIERLRACGIHVVIGGVSLPNAVSIALHEGLGFEPIGAFREVGWKLGRWIDVGYWQLRLDDPTVA